MSHSWTPYGYRMLVHDFEYVPSQNWQWTNLKALICIRFWISTEIDFSELFWYLVSTSLQHILQSYII